MQGIEKCHMPSNNFTERLPFAVKNQMEVLFHRESVEITASFLRQLLPRYL